MIPSKASVNETILVDNRIKEVYLFNLHANCQNEVICDAVQINLISGQEIFLDPIFYYGIGIGDRGQKEWWKNNLLDKIPDSEEIILLES